MSLGFKRLARTVVGIMGVSGLGCASTCGDPTSTTDAVLGELGNGDFRFECLQRTDAACPPQATNDTPPPFPDCVVTGARFDLSYTLVDHSVISEDIPDRTLGLTAASTDFFGDYRPFQARRSGRAAVLVHSGAQVVDLLHLDIVDATQIAFVTSTGESIDDQVQLAQGEQLTIFAHPEAEGCYVPGGSLPLSVRAQSDVPRRSVVRVGVSDALELQGAAIGSTTLLVELGELGRELNVSVIAGSDPSSTAGTGDSGTSGTGTGTDPATDTATDAGTSTDTGTDSGTGTNATDTDTDATTGSTTGGG